MGGHWVQGHVDAVGEVARIEPEGAAQNFTFAAPPEIMRYAIEKGSVCVAGVGLTITGLGRRELLGLARPAHPRRDHARRARPGRSCEPRGRRAGEIRRKAGISRRSATIGGDLMSSRAEYLDAYPELGGEWPFAPIEQAIADIREGRMVVVVDSTDRENEGDLVMAAQHVTPEAINFMATHGRGIICLSLTPGADRGAAVSSRWRATTRRRSARRSPCRSRRREGVSTGISAADRAHTDPGGDRPRREPGDLVRPGHVFPLRARPCGVLVRAGQTEASVDLARLAGLQPAGVICEIMNEDGSMARVPDLVGYCGAPRAQDDHASPTWSPTGAGTRSSSSGSRRRRCRPGTASSSHTATASMIDGQQHVGARDGRRRRRRRAVLVRVHSECLTGDVFGSLRCDCGDQLDERASRRSRPRGAACSCTCRQEGRGIGLLEQAAGVRAAGAGARHRRGQPGARASASTARLRRRAPDPGRPRAHARCGSSPTTRRRSSASRATGS